jgi:hypothetical protein
LLFGLAAAVGLAIFAAVGGVRPHARPLSLILATASGSALVTAFALALALGRGTSMLGRSRRLLLAAIALLPLALLVWKMGVSSLYDGMNVAWPARPGARCLGLALAIGALPLAAALAVRRRSDPVQPSLTGAALGAAVGLAAASLVDLWCPVAHLQHLLVGHLLPIALLALAGALTGSRLLAVRFRP